MDQRRIRKAVLPISGLSWICCCRYLGQMSYPLLVSLQPRSQPQILLADHLSCWKDVSCLTDLARFHCKFWHEIFMDRDTGKCASTFCSKISGKFKRFQITETATAIYTLGTSLDMANRTLSFLKHVSWGIWKTLTNCTKSVFLVH